MAMRYFVTQFAFVLFGLALAAGAVGDALNRELIVEVSLSMVVSPLLFLLNDRMAATVAPPPAYDEIEEQHTPVISRDEGTPWLH